MEKKTNPLFIVIAALALLVGLGYFGFKVYGDFFATQSGQVEQIQQVEQEPVLGVKTPGLEPEQLQQETQPTIPFERLNRVVETTETILDKLFALLERLGALLVAVVPTVLLIMDRAKKKEEDPPVSKFEEILEEAFEKDETLYLAEGLFPITPMLAISAFKDNVIKKAKSIFTPYNFERAGSDLKSKALIAREKARSVMGAKDADDKEETFYGFTKEQKEVLRDVYNKYGKKVINSILEFRNNVLAPYSVLKRQIKKNVMLTPRETFGLTKEQYNSALESGRKKIERRATIEQDREELEEKIDLIQDRIEGLRKAKQEFSSGSNSLSDSVKQNLFKKLEVDVDSLGGIPLEQFAKAKSQMKSSLDDARRFQDAALKNKKPLETFINSIDKYIEAQKGNVDIEKKEKDELGDIKSKISTVKGGKNFLNYYIKYLFREEIVEKLKPGSNSYFRNLYSEIIDRMISELVERRNIMYAEWTSLKKNTEFTENEKKIYALKKGYQDDEYDGNMDHYDIKIKPEDFFQPVYFKKTENIVETEKKIEAEIKRFERSLQNFMEPEDFQKLKRYRLINNLIVLKELKNPDDLFKTKEEITSLKTSSSDEVAPVQQVSKKDVEGFLRLLKEVATKEYDSMKELFAAKKDLKEIMDAIIDTDDGKDAIEDNSVLVRQALARQSTSAQKSMSSQQYKKQIVDIDDIEEMAKSIILKKYSDPDVVKNDNRRFKDLIDDFKSQNINAESQLQDIEYLLARVEQKIKKEISYKSED